MSDDEMKDIVPMPAEIPAEIFEILELQRKAIEEVCGVPHGLLMPEKGGRR